jgi:uncharacterized membrane protein
MDFSAWELKFYEFVDKLPFDLAIYHPHIVHYAVALPFVAFIFQLLSISAPDKGHQSTSNMLFLIGAMAIILAFVSGQATAQDVKPLLNIPAQDLFDKHQSMGRYLALIYFLLMFFRIFASSIKNEGARSVITMLTFAALLGLGYEIITGHELVYDYGAGTLLEYDR